MLNSLCNKWWCLLLRGLAAVVAGVIAFTHPALTAAVIAILIGVNALIDGAMCVFIGIRGGGDGRPWWEMILLGLVGVGFGAAALAWPGPLLATLVIFVGAWAIARGIVEIAAAIKLRKVIDDEWLLALSGAFSVAFGILLLSKPIEGILAISMVIGCFLFAYGLAAVAFSFRLRSLRKNLA